MLKKPKFINNKKKDLFCLQVKYNLIKVKEKNTMFKFSLKRKVGKKKLLTLCLLIAVITTISLVIFVAFSTTTVSPDDGSGDDGSGDDDCF